MTHKGTVTLETKRLILRRFNLDDLKAMFDNCWSDFDVWKWSSYDPMNSVSDVLKLNNIFTDFWFAKYEKQNHYDWAIQLKETSKVVGRVRGMHPDDSIGQIELAYEIGKPWWNQGLMTEAVKEVINFLFKEVGFNRISAYHASENLASGKVLKKAGMSFEGTMRQACRCNNGLFDRVNFAILADGFLKEAKDL